MTRHSWQPPSRTEYHTERVCRKCGMVRVTRHDAWPPWLEWQDREGRAVVMSSGSPECKSEKDDDQHTD